MRPALRAGLSSGSPWVKKTRHLTRLNERRGSGTSGSSENGNSSRSAGLVREALVGEEEEPEIRARIVDWEPFDAVGVFVKST